MWPLSFLSEIIRSCKKSLKIPKEQSESVYRRRTYNTMAKRKSTKGQTMIYKHTYAIKDRVTRTPLKTGGTLWCSGRVISSCSTSGTRHVNREVATARETYPWSFVTQIFHNGQPNHGGDRNIFEVMTLILPKGTIGSVASLVAATLYQGNPDRNHKLLNIVTTPCFQMWVNMLALPYTSNHARSVIMQSVVHGVVY
jgi:hypothetical protein